MEQRIFLVEAKDYRIIDTWFVAGLRGTGSKDVEMAEIFVPAHRTLPLNAIAGGVTPGSEANPGALYQLPALGLFSFVVAAVSLGLARGAVAEYRDGMTSRIGAYTGKRLADLAGVQLRLAEAAALTDIAEALMLKDCDEATRLTESGKGTSLADKARCRRRRLCRGDVHQGGRARSLRRAARRSISTGRCSAPSATSSRPTRITR